MGVHEDRPSVWRELPSQQIDYYRKVLAVHATDAHSGTCPVCRIPRCFDWRNAYEILTSSGALVVDPDQPGDDEPVDGSQVPSPGARPVQVDEVSETPESAQPAGLEPRRDRNRRQPYNLGPFKKP